jgi:hypothetical protein
MLHQHDEIFFISKVSCLAPLHFGFEYLYTSFLSIVNLHLLVLNFLGDEKGG